MTIPPCVEACNKAKEIIMERNFSCLQADLQASNMSDNTELLAEPITSKQKLPSYANNWFAWNEDGGTTGQTCEGY